ncbi:MAG: hypothetical protein QNJ31_05330 [Candidatus Caenarcaniphilales bacterium]|nr:hypothetical protein [Candidatus Caenarcaniphilales bacterium]
MVNINNFSHSFTNNGDVNQNQTASQNINQNQAIINNFDAGNAASKLLDRMRQGDSFVTNVGQSNNNSGSVNVGSGQGMLGFQGINQNQIMFGPTGGSTVIVQGNTEPPPPIFIPVPDEHIPPEPIVEPEPAPVPVNPGPKPEPPPEKHPDFKTDTFPCVITDKHGNTVYPAHYAMHDVRMLTVEKDGETHYFKADDYFNSKQYSNYFYGEGKGMTLAESFEAGHIKPLPTSDSGQPIIAGNPEPAKEGVHYSYG